MGFDGDARTEAGTRVGAAFTRDEVGVAVRDVDSAAGLEGLGVRKREAGAGEAALRRDVVADIVDVVRVRDGVDFTGVREEDGCGKRDMVSSSRNDSDARAVRQARRA